MGYDFQSPDMEITHASALLSSPSFSLVAGVDIDPSKCDLFESRFGLPAFRSLASVPPALHYSLLVVSTPTRFHTSVVEEAVSLGSPVAMLLEKPVGTDSDQASAIEAILRSQGVRAWVNYMRRSDPLFISWRDHLALRRDSQTEISLEFAGDLRNTGSHFLDLISWLVESPLTCVRAYQGTDDACRLAELDAGGISVSVSWSDSGDLNESSPSHKLAVRQGGLTYEYSEPHCELSLVGDRGRSRSVLGVSSVGSGYQRHVYQLLARAMGGEETSLCSLRQAVETQRLIDDMVTHIEKAGS